MANSIRTPKKGNTRASEMIANAVDNEEWQKFRVSLKGTPTETKLARLRAYLEAAFDSRVEETFQDVLIQVDNYLKALARGGLIAVPPDGLYVFRLRRNMLEVLK